LARNFIRESSLIKNEISLIFLNVFRKIKYSIQKRKFEVRSIIGASNMHLTNTEMMKLI
jgi:hypothetical protein